MAFDVFETDGEFLGRVVFPWEVAPAPNFRMRGDLVWCVVRDEEGVEMIRRYRIAWP